MSHYLESPVYPTHTNLTFKLILSSPPLSQEYMPHLRLIRNSIPPALSLFFPLILLFQYRKSYSYVS